MKKNLTFQHFSDSNNKELIYEWGNVYTINDIQGKSHAAEESLSKTLIRNE